MTEEPIILSGTRGGVAVVTLNRPDKLNALSESLNKDLLSALDQLAKDEQVKAIILTGAGRGFSAGADLQSSAISDRETNKPSLGAILRNNLNPIVIRIRTMEKPVIAGVNGVAAGAGMSLALACDYRIASENASFLQAFCKIGLIPDAGSTFMLSRLVSPTKAFELMTLGEKFGAEEAFTLGIVNKVVPDDLLIEECRNLAKRLVHGATLAFALTKRAFNKVLFSDLEELLENEAELQEIAGRSEDFAEGVRAFNGKRQPKYFGR
jgi:2-(1,2-epoxy-1,2-dihydrophenyl)acetyl-CoA isomerase